MAPETELAVCMRSARIAPKWYVPNAQETSSEDALRDAAHQVVALLGGDREQAARWVGIKLDLLEQLMEP